MLDRFEVINCFLSRISLILSLINPILEVYQRHFYFGPIRLSLSVFSLNATTVAIPSTFPGTLPSPMSIFWTSMYIIITVNSAPLSISYPPISLLQLLSSHINQTLYHSFSCHMGAATFTLTLPTSLMPLPPVGTQSLTSKNSYSVDSITQIPSMKSPPPKGALLLLTIHATTASNGS